MLYCLYILNSNEIQVNYHLFLFYHTQHICILPQIGYSMVSPSVREIVFVSSFVNGLGALVQNKRTRTD